MTLKQLQDKIVECEGFVNLDSDDVNSFSSAASYKIATIREHCPSEDFQKFISGIGGKKVLLCLFLTHTSKISMQALAPLCDLAESLSPNTQIIWGAEYLPEEEHNLQIAAIYE